MKKINLILCFCGILSTTVFAANLEGLLADERNNIEIFQEFSTKVVNVHKLAIDHKTKLYKKVGAGSGIIWDKQGHIVTNYHVVKNAEKLAVQIGSWTVPAKVIGAEPRKDIAVLMLARTKPLAFLHKFRPFVLKPSQDLLVGQKVLAIGNPFGLDHSLTTGVISALGRKVPGIAGLTIYGMIQTDASINPGNSGGPLLDSQGRLIGLNTVILSNTGSSAGIGFAVSTDDIARLVPQIIQKGRAATVGIGITPMDVKGASRLGVAKGLLIAKVLPQTPASQAGLQGTVKNRLGDVIVGLNGHPVVNYDSFYNLLSIIAVNDVIKLTIVRQGKTAEYRMKTIDVAAMSQ